MDDLGLIIIIAFVTSIIGGIISNLVFLRYQKRVEVSFAKQLEEFRSKLEYSNFEQEARYTNIQPKRLETLELLCKKVSSIARSFSELCDKANLIYRQPEVDVNISISDYDKVYEMIDEFHDVLKDNKPYISMILYVRINGIESRVQYFHITLSLLLPFFHHDETQWEAIKMMCARQDFYNKIDWENPSFQQIITELSLAVDREMDKMAYIYKSVADLSYDDRTFDENAVQMYSK